MSVKDKINEAEYNFKKLAQIQHWDDGFQFEVNNFLCSACSIPDHLLEDYKTKFGFKFEKTNYTNFKSMAEKIKSENSTPKKFIDWEKKEFDDILENEIYGFLFDERNRTVHVSTNRPYWIGPAGALTIHTINGEKRFYQPQIWFFDQSVQVTISFELIGLEVCRLFLERLKKLVDDAHAKF